jgi:hypothetical protein
LVVCSSLYIEVVMCVWTNFLPFLASIIWFRDNKLVLKIFCKERILAYLLFDYLIDLRFDYGSCKNPRAQKLMEQIQKEYLNNKDRKRALDILQSNFYDDDYEESLKLNWHWLSGLLYKISTLYNLLLEKHRFPDECPYASGWFLCAESRPTRIQFNHYPGCSCLPCDKGHLSAA